MDTRASSSTPFRSSARSASPQLFSSSRKPSAVRRRFRGTARRRTPSRGLGSDSGGDGRWYRGRRAFEHASLAAASDRRGARRELVESRDILHHATGVSPQFFATRSAIGMPGSGTWCERPATSEGSRSNFWSERPARGLMGAPSCQRARRDSDAAFEAWASGCHGLSTH